MDLEDRRFLSRAFVAHLAVLALALAIVAWVA